MVRQNFEGDVNGEKVELSPEDAQAVREVADKANTGQNPEDRVKALLADIHFPELCNTRWLYTVPLYTKRTNVARVHIGKTTGKDEIVNVRTVRLPYPLSYTRTP